MPRSPTVYNLPAATVPKVPLETISSAQWNAAMNDIAATFNTAQPIAYGGTGATTVITAHDALNTRGTDVATAATLNLDTATGQFVDLTGTTTVTAVTLADGKTRLTRAASAFQITVGASLIGNNGGSNVSVEAGDLIIWEGYAAGVVRFWLTRASGKTVSASTVAATGRNRIVNSDMALSQENGNTLGTVNGYYPADQFALFFTTTGAGRSIQRVQARTLSGSLNQLEYKCTTAKGSLSAGDSEMISQNLEGSNVADCAFGTAAAKPFVDRFQVQLPAGTYHMHYSNSASNRHCAVPFVISGGEANTAVVKSVVVPADTGGTWLTADGVIGMTRDLILAAGSTFTGGTASTWGATMYFAATAQANILSSTANVARLADVGLRLDPDATGVYGQYEVGETHAVYRSERYWEKSYNDGVAPGTVTTEGNSIGAGGSTAAGNSVIPCNFKLRKCKVPTMTAYSPATGAAGNCRGSTGTDRPVTTDNAGTGSAYFTNTGTISSSDLKLAAHWTANARLS